MDPIEPFHLTNEQWADITRHYPLPGDVRTDLDNLATNYCVFRDSRAQRLPNSQVKAGLARISKTSGKLLRLLESLGPDEMSALTDPERCGDSGGPTPRRDALVRIVEHIEGLKRLEEWSRDVAATLPEQPRGFDPGDLNWLVEHVAQSFERNTSQPFAEQPGRRKAVAAYVSAIEGEMREGSVDNAIDLACSGNNRIKKMN